MTWKTRAVTAALLGAMLGCSDPTTVQADGDRAAVEDRDGQPVDPGEGQLVLAVGEGAVVPGTEVRVTFEGVLGDSRCPIDAICVWAGDAEVALTLALGADSPDLHVLHWNTAQGPGAVMVGPYRVSLVALDPLPRAGETVPADAYRAQVKAERR